MHVVNLPSVHSAQVFVLVENAMVSGAATSALQAPSLASSSGLGPANDTNAGPVVPATPAPAEASGTVAARHLSFHSALYVSLYSLYYVFKMRVSLVIECRWMRKVVESKEMGMGALANTCGVGMALKTMADSEKNPILIDGAPSLCNLLVAGLPLWSPLQLLCCRVGANEFETLNDAYAAVAQAGASVGAMVVKAGAKKTQNLTPSKVMSPPFEGGVQVDGFYPQMSVRLRCDRKHDSTYESVRNSGKQTGLVDERRGVHKGVPACLN